MEYSPSPVHTQCTPSEWAQNNQNARFLRLPGRADIPRIDPAGVMPKSPRIVGNVHLVAEDLQSIRPHLRVRQVGLDDHLRVLRIGDVDRREVLGRALVAGQFTRRPSFVLCIPMPSPMPPNPPISCCKIASCSASGSGRLLAPAHCFSPSLPPLFGTAPYGADFFQVSCLRAAHPATYRPTLWPGLGVSDSEHITFRRRTAPVSGVIVTAFRGPY